MYLLKLEIPDGIEGVGEVARLFSSQRISTVCPFVTLFGTGMVSTVKG